MKNYWIVLFCLLYMLPLKSQDLTDFRKIASYPFIADAKDATGLNEDAMILKAVFQNGGIYSNGIYYGSDTSGALIRTPQIKSFDVKKFALQLEFNTDITGRPLIAFGDAWRWLTVNIKPDSGIELFANKTDGFGHILNAPFKVEPGKWYQLGIVYDSTSGELSVYVDDVLLKKDTLTASFLHSNDFTFANQHSGTGIAYKGYWRNLNIYAPRISSGLRNERVSRTETTLSFDPLKNRLILIADLPGGHCFISDLNGRVIWKAAYPGEIRQIALPDLIPGIYIATLIPEGAELISKVIYAY